MRAAAAETAIDDPSTTTNATNSNNATNTTVLSPQDDARIREALESRPSMVRAMDRHRAPDDGVGANGDDEAWLAELGYHDNRGFVSNERDVGQFRYKDKFFITRKRKN